MFIVAKHAISNPQAFWETARQAMDRLPADVTFHGTYPNEGGTEAFCLWEADSVARVQELLDQALGAYAQNITYAVDERLAVGLPQVAAAA